MILWLVPDELTNLIQTKESELQRRGPFRLFQPEEKIDESRKAGQEVLLSRSELSKLFAEGKADLIKERG